mmetsp:Transcript_16270/g.40484  ORF Transcript_16270/g.40484 Transcript_16270/m.40484 type:complete len:200 (-) Transcript_16270:4351-4950(-)
MSKARPSLAPLLPSTPVSSLLCWVPRHPRLPPAPCWLAHVPTGSCQANSPQTAALPRAPASPPAAPMSPTRSWPMERIARNLRRWWWRMASTGATRTLARSRAGHVTGRCPIVPALLPGAASALARSSASLAAADRPILRASSALRMAPVQAARTTSAAMLARTARPATTWQCTRTGSSPPPPAPALPAPPSLLIRPLL